MAATEVFRKPDGTWARNVIACTGRNVCGKWLQNNNGSGIVAAMCKDYLNQQPEGRKSLCPKTHDLPGTDIGENMLSKIVHHDTAALASFNCESRKAATGSFQNTNYCRALEFCVCTGLSSASDQLHRICKALKEEGQLDSGRSWLLMCHEKMSQLGGCNIGSCHRTSPHCNKATTRGDLVRSLVALHKAFEQVNNYSEQDLQRLGPVNVFDHLISVIDNKRDRNAFCGVGSLCGHRITMTAICLGLIRHAELGNFAVCNKGTQTCDRLTRIMGHRPPAKNLLRDVSLQLGSEWREMEGLTCETLKPSDRSCAEAEPHLIGQSHRKPIKLKDGNWVIGELPPDSADWQPAEHICCDTSLPTGNVGDGLSWWEHLGPADKAGDQNLQQLDAILVDVIACSDGIPTKRGRPRKKTDTKPAQRPVKLSAVHMMQDWELHRSKNLQRPTVWSPRVPDESMEPLRCSVGRRDDALVMAQEKELSQTTDRPLTQDNVLSVGRLTVTAIKSLLVEHGEEGQHHPCWKKAALVSAITLTILNAEDGMRGEILHRIESCHANKNGQHIPCATRNKTDTSTSTASAKRSAKDATVGKTAGNPLAKKQKTSGSHPAARESVPIADSPSGGGGGRKERRNGLVLELGTARGNPRLILDLCREAQKAFDSHQKKSTLLADSLQMHQLVSHGHPIRFHATVAGTLHDKTNVAGRGKTIDFGRDYAGLVEHPSDHTRKVRLFFSKAGAREHAFLLCLVEHGMDILKEYFAFGGKCLDLIKAGDHKKIPVCTLVFGQRTTQVQKPSSGQPCGTPLPTLPLPTSLFVAERRFIVRRVANCFWWHPDPRWLRIPSGAALVAAPSLAGRRLRVTNNSWWYCNPRWLQTPSGAALLFVAERRFFVRHVANCSWWRRNPRWLRMPSGRAVTACHQQLLVAL